MNYRKVIEDCGGILDAEKTGEHYVYTSGRHGGLYIEKRRFLKDPVAAGQLADGFADELWESFCGCTPFMDVFLGAQVCGAKFENYIAMSYLNSRVSKNNSYEAQQKIICIEAEKKIVKRKEALFLRDEYKKDISGKKVLLVEDIINTGKTIFELIDLVHGSGGEVIGIGSIWNRGDIDGNTALKYVRSRYNTPFFIFFSLVTEKLESYSKKDCPYCRKGIPISKEHGHG